MKEYKSIKASALFKENLRIALKSIRTNLLRTILTIFIIAIGIMALVGILTAIESIKVTLTRQFTRLGANTFTIQPKRGRYQGEERTRVRNSPNITFRQALRFNEEFNFPTIISIST